MSHLTFLPFEPVVDPSFWHKLSQIKLDVDRLSEAPRSIRGYFLDNTCLSLFVDYSSFNEEDNVRGKIGSSGSTSLTSLCSPGSNHRIPLGVLPGVLINFNTLEAFKSTNKNQLLEEEGAKIWTAIKTGAGIDDPTLLNRFVIITFSDLKKYDFVFWFGFPALGNFSFPLVGSPVLLSSAFTELQIKSIFETHSSLQWPNKEIFCIVQTADRLRCETLRYFIDNFENGSETLYLCAVDGSTDPFVPGWTCRNLLSLVGYYRKSEVTVKIIVLRLGTHFKSSFVCEFDFQREGDEPKVVGWSKNARGKYGPKSVNLRDSIDPLRLADTSVDLNLKLMKWRLAPQLDLDVVKNHKALLIGAGTLGCTVARCLMGWGVRHITFVDDGSVSFSNPVRQSLYGYEDCDLGEGAKKKADAAPAALKRTLPTMTSAGIAMTVPMPGHTTEGLTEATKLHELIKDHDTVFLLTDSRESRWLPTVIAASMNKLAITAALGYDTYLVMRHGVQTEPSVAKLGCYFCNDITAPGNSKADRTLDQQCTVTRPGVSYMAGSIAAEILVSVLQHPEGSACSAGQETFLGVVPHSVRGFLFQFSQMLPSTLSFDQCIACSPKVIEQYKNNRDEFLSSVFKSVTFLEDLTGLTQLHLASDSADILELSDDESIGEM